MKLKRLTAIVLTLAMLFSILPLTGTVYATENEEKEVDVTTADYPIMIKDRINTARLTKIGQYSELTDEEKDAVCKYYHLEDSIFVACEKAGYNILDSVRIAKAANAAEVTPAEYKEYVTAYGSEEEASHQLWGYKNFKDMLGEKYQHEFASLMKKGYRQADLRGTFHVANKLNTSMGEIVPDNKNITNKSEAKTELELFSNTYFCDAQKIQQVSKEKNVNLTELVSIISYDKAVTKENVVSSKESNNETKEKAMTASISSPNISQNSKINSLSHEFISAPISVYTENDEQVNASTGVFSYRENVVDLKGKGGLDLDLDLVFTGNANLYYGWSTSTETRTDWYNTSIGVTKNLINYPLGVGWSFNLPQISYTKEWESISSQSNPNLGRNVVTYRYHMKDGGAYKINGNTLVDYPRTDVTLSSATNDPDVSVSLWKKVTFADGRYESFDAEGRIRVMGDRWGNKIIFDYYPSTATSLRNYPEYAEGALGLITDSLGRKIRITYSQDPYENDDPHHRWVYIEYSDNTTSYEARIDMYAENSDAGPYKVQSIDVGPNGKTFTYHNEQTIQCTDELYTDDFDLIAGNNVILNMASVTYDSGLTSYYQYAKTTVNNGTGGAKNIYRVSNRYETDPNQYINDNPNSSLERLLATNYTYYGDYSGYSSRAKAPYDEQELYMDPNNLPESHEYQVLKNKASVQTTTTYNNHQAPKFIETYAIDDDYSLSEEYFTYDEYELLTEKRTIMGITAVSDYSNPDEYAESIEMYENDSKGNVVKKWSTHAKGVKSDEYLTTYTYSDTYNLPLAVTYKQSPTQVISEINTLSSDAKSITRREVKENNVVKERTDYEYDTYGNVTKERKYISDTEYIDVNFDYSDTEDASRLSGTDYDGAYLTRMWQDGGEDIDGNEIGNIEYTYEYDYEGNKVKETNPIGESTSYAYDTYKRITKITNPDNTTQIFSYALTSTSNNTTHTDEKGTQLLYEYDASGHLLNVQDVLSGESLSSYDYDKMYKLKMERNTQLYYSGYILTITYDDYRRVIEKEITASDDSVVSNEKYSYDPARTSKFYITTHTITGDAAAEDIVTKEYVDEDGNIAKIGYVTGTNEYFATYKYDYLGNKTEELSAVADQKDWTNTFTSKWEYDYAGRVTKEYDADNKYMLYEYDLLGRPVKFYDKNATALEEPYYTSYTYDALGNVIRETVPQTATTDKITEFKYDKLGRVTEQRSLYDIVNNAEQYHTVTYTYDWRGNVLTATQGGVTTTYTYDNLGRCLTSTTDGKTTTYTYDRFGNCLTETFAGKTDTYEYDMNNFMVRQVDKAGTVRTFTPNALQQIAAKWVSGGTSRSYWYSLTGQPTELYTGGGSIMRYYDDRGNLKKETTPGSETLYTYDIAGNRIGFVAKALSTETENLTYTYNTLGQLTAVNNANTPVVAYTYDNNGNIATEAKSAVTQSYTYNRDGSVASIVTTNNIDNTSETTAYTYYLNGNLKTETLPDNTTKTYTYNNRDMLVTEALSTGKTTTYAYNNSGNRTSKTVTQNSQNTVTSYTYDNTNRLTQEQTGSNAAVYYAYDDIGNMIRRSVGSADAEAATLVDTFVYNCYNELERATVNGVSAYYDYWANGLRKTKSVGGEVITHIWDGENIATDINSDYTIANNYIRGLRLAEISDGTATRQYTFNAHGDVTGLVDTTTGAVTDYTYDAYGNEDNASATDTNPFRYSGEYYDAETGFIYLRARYYDPSIGRFTAEDPIRDGTNWYVYCNNNPVMYVDPTGYIAVDDGVYNSWTQDKLLGYTLDYYNAYFAGDAKAMSAAANSAQALRVQSSPQAWYSRLFDTQAARTENNLILSHQKALSLGYTEGSVEYGMALTAYTLAMNDIDERGQLLYDNLLQLYSASAMGTLSIAKSTQVGKWDKATFQSEAKYADHYRRHGKDFGNVSKTGYLQGARDLLNKETGKNIQGFVSKDGSLFKYNTKTNEFAIGSPYGTISTYYKPKNGYSYWLDQISRYK